MWWSDALKEELADMEAQRNKKVAELSAYKVRIINKVVEDLEDLTTCPKSLIKELGRVHWLHDSGIYLKETQNKDCQRKQQTFISWEKCFLWD